MTISADDYLDRPIDSLVFWAARLVQRAVHYTNMDDETANSTVAQSLMKKDEQMRMAYLVALRLRAREVCEYAAKLGIRCEPSQVCESPFEVVCALMHHVGALGDE